MSVDRIQQGAAETIQAELTVNGIPADPSPDAATVTVLRADGTVLVNAQTANDSGTGIFSYPLTPTHTALLDNLVAQWTFTSGGQAQTRTTRHQVVGGFLCSFGELDAVLPGRQPSDLLRIRTQLEQRLEKTLGYACVPRYEYVLLPVRNGKVRTKLPLRAVRSLLVGGTAYTSGQLAALRLTSAAVEGFWTYGPVMIGYEYGRDYPDEDITRAMLLAADEVYGTQAVGVGAPVVSQQADNMSVTYGAYLVADRPFVGSELNAIIRANALPSIF